MKNKYVLLLIALLWIFILGYILTKHQTLINTGKTIILKTEPVDPRDPFKGDYVVLRYDISTIQKPLTDGEKEELMKTSKIYAILKPKEHYWVLDRFSTKKPPLNETFIKGYVWGQKDDWMRIHYNIESYYVPEGKGKEIEQQLGNDIFVELAVNVKGEATIIRLLKGKEPYQFKE